MRILNLVILACLTVAPAAADLLVVEHPGPEARDAAIAEGVPVVAEFERHLILFGDADELAPAIRRRGLAAQVVARGDDGGWATVWLNDPRDPAPPAACGPSLWNEGRHHITAPESPDALAACAASPKVFARRLPLRPMRPPQPSTSRYAGGTFDSPLRLTPLPLVTEIVTGLTDAAAMTWWQDVVGAATTRYSYSAGAQAASDWAAAEFAAMGLVVEQPHHTTGMAPNVVGELTGTTRPDDIVILIGHLDDLPSSGPAPGADDNASGSAMVLAAAEALSCYRFEATLRFILVTGEEQGLYGSSDVADAMAAGGETPIGVLNGDMIGWEGDGTPAPEDLDVNYNGASEWLATLFAQAASDYATGLAVNAFSCPSMTYSDHAPFWSEGWSALCGITDNHGFCGHDGTYPGYHQSSDTIANCGPGAQAFFGAAVRTYVATAAHLAVPTSRVTATPSNLSATPSGANTVDLAWTAGAAGLTHEVRRTPGGCDAPWPAQVVATTTAESAVDSAASGGLTYGYDVRSWGPAGVCVSAATTCVETEATGACLEPPQFGGLDTATDIGADTCAVELDWTAAEQLWCGGPAAYRVYRSTDHGFTPSQATLVTEVSDTSWIDSSGVGSHEETTWVVRAVDLATGVEDANTVRRTATATGPVTLGTWSDDGGDSGAGTMVATAPWYQAPGEGIGGGSAWFTGSYGTMLCSGLETPQLTLGAGAQLRFFTRHDIETSWDKGEVQISVDGGSSWQRLELDYPTSCSDTSDACGLPAGDFFSGEQTSWAEYLVDLSSWQGQAITIRWLLSSDTSQNGAGWWLDDISITQAGVPGPCTPGSATAVFSDGFESGGTTAWSTSSP